MPEIILKGRLGDSRIVTGLAIEDLGSYLPAKPLFIVIDPEVDRIYGSLLPDAPRIVVGTGEAQKTAATVESIWKRLIELEADRGAFVLAVGGGITLDLAGFAASTYLRGVSFGFCPSTLLSQVDASVGGKNGVNVGGFKNMAGTFRQPELVLACPEFLKSLPLEEIRGGLAESIKHGAILDEAHFSFIEANLDRLLAKDLHALSALVANDVEIKARVVVADEEEGGYRRILNFGHSLCHALERATGMSHGYAVAVGMAFASRLSAARGLLPEADAKRLVALLGAAGLPSSACDEGIPCPAGADELIEALRRDKKRAGAAINFVMLEAIGRARIEALPLADIEAAIREAFPA
jgi:3-dehydroquinate synthase